MFDVFAMLGGEKEEIEKEEERRAKREAGLENRRKGGEERTVVVVLVCLEVRELGPLSIWGRAPLSCCRQETRKERQGDR